MSFFQDPANIVLTIMSLLIVAMVWSWHRDKANGFRLEQTVIDSVTGKVAVEKIGFMVALAVSTWGFISMVMKGQMTEWYFVGYIGVFAVTRAASMGMSVLKDVKTSFKLTDKAEEPK